MMELLLVIHAHGDSVLPLRIFFSVCLVVVFFAGIYVFTQRRRMFGHDPEVPHDNWASRNLRLWQVLLVWVLALELLISVIVKI